MKAEYLPLSDTGFVSRMVLDYIEGNKELEAFHNGIPSFENLNSQALQKKATYNSNIRKTLCYVLAEQYKEIDCTSKVAEHIKLLRKQTTLTVTTGHQLCLMTGPLYFIYKLKKRLRIYL